MLRNIIIINQKIYHSFLHTHYLFASVEKKPFFTQLKNRSLICVEGKDSKKLLQGIITNDIQQLQKNKFALYTSFLNVKARLISDAILFCPNKFNKNSIQRSKDQYWLDIHAQLKDKLINHINKYTWKKDVKVHAIETPAKIYAIYNHISFNDVPSQQSGNQIVATYSDVGDQGNYSNLTYYDPRTPKLGLRLVAEANTFSVADFEQVQLEIYQQFKAMSGILEGPSIVDKIPFQFNLDLLNGISFNKGCYLGQQLISRSYHTGIVRKRIFPFIVMNYDNNLKIEIDDQIVNQKQIKIGKILQINKNIVLGLVDYLQLNDEKDCKIKSPFIGQLISPYHQKIEQYINLMKQKQQNLSKLL